MAEPAGSEKERGMRVTVRRGTAGDAEALTRLRLGEHGPDDDFALAFPAWVAAHRDSHRPFVAEVDGEVAGMAWLLVAERVPAPGRPVRRFGDVQSVYVTPESRRRGVGAALMAAVLDEARSAGMEHVTVHSSDQAVTLYERAGFGTGPTWLSWVPE